MFCELVTTTKIPNVNKHLLSLLSRLGTTLVQNVRFNVTSSVSYLSCPKNSVKQGEAERKRQADVGITEFMGSHPKIFATLKEKTADFQVHEIDTDGRRVQLTDLNATPITNDSADGRGRKMDRTGKEFIHCVLYKDAIEHGQAITFIAKNLGADIDEITYAGRKDKIGQTVQKLCFPHVFSTEQVAKWSTDWEKMKLGNFSYSSQFLNRGQLSGNHFKILLRCVQLLGSNDHNDEATYSSLAAAAAAVDVAVSSLREVGFVNYFGLQRFGAGAHRIGQALLKEEWKKVFDLFLTPLPSDSDHMLELITMWAEGHTPPAIMKCFTPEKIRPDQRNIIFKTLADNYRCRGDRDLVAAFRELPEYIQSFAIQPFSSYIWNKLASLRVKEFGLKVLPGDYIVVPPAQQEKEEDSNFRDYRDVLKHRKEKTKILTAEDLVDGHPYTIYDVLLPVTGYKSIGYPNKVLQDLYEMILAEEGLSADCFTTFKQRYGQIQIPAGNFRSLIVKPKDVDHKLCITHHFLGTLTHLMPSDLDLLRIQGKLKDEVVNSTTSSSPVDHQENSQHSLAKFVTAKEIEAAAEVDEGEEGSRNLCAMIEFGLPQSSYATMALREIMMYHRPIRSENNNNDGDLSKDDGDPSKDDGDPSKDEVDSSKDAP